MLRRKLALLFAAVALVAAACGGGDSDTASVPGESAGEPSAATPDFSGQTVLGEQLVAGDLAGQDVVLWFWAPW